MTVPTLPTLLLAAAAMLACSAQAAADTVRIGVLGPFSGPFATYGENFRAGIEAWFARNGTAAGGHEMEVVFRDLPGADPARARALAQELVVAEEVQYLAGLYFTPDALAIAPLLEEAGTPLVIFNAAASAITAASPLVVRTSFTMAQNSAPMGTVAARRGLRRAVTVVADYAPGADAQAAFAARFEQEGGAVLDDIRVPLSTVDFSPVMQRVLASGADAMFAFLPSGPTTLGFVRAYDENGLRARGVELLATGDMVPESDLAAFGEAAEGILSTYHYAVSHESEANRDFREAAAAALVDPSRLTYPAVAAFDGMRLIARMIEATDGKRDAGSAVDAVKGWSFESPRGPFTLDPTTRSPIQTVYLREVRPREGGGWENREIDRFPETPDLGWPR